MSGAGRLEKIANEIMIANTAFFGKRAPFPRSFYDRLTDQERAEVVRLVKVKQQIKGRVNA